MIQKIAIPLIAILLLACVWYFFIFEKEVQPEATDTLTIERVAWAGNAVADKNIIPALEKTQEQILKGKVIRLQGVSDTDTYNVTVEKIYHGKVKLSTMNLSVKTGEELKTSTINLTECSENASKPKQFELKKGEKAILTTCSLDVGVTWYISY